MSEIGGVGFNPFASALNRSTADQANAAQQANEDDDNSNLNEAQLAAQDPAAAAIADVTSTDAVGATQGTQAGNDNSSDAQSGQGRTVEDQVVLSDQARSSADQAVAEANTAAVQGDAQAGNPTAGEASDELTNPSRVDGNQDSGGTADGGNRERAQIIDQFA